MCISQMLPRLVMITIHNSILTTIPSIQLDIEVFFYFFSSEGACSLSLSTFACVLLISFPLCDKQHALTILNSTNANSSSNCQNSFGNYLYKFNGWMRICPNEKNNFCVCFVHFTIEWNCVRARARIWDHIHFEFFIWLREKKKIEIVQRVLSHQFLPVWNARTRIKLINWTLFSFRIGFLPLKRRRREKSRMKRSLKNVREIWKKNMRTRLCVCTYPMALWFNINQKHSDGELWRRLRAALSNVRKMILENYVFARLWIASCSIDSSVLPHFCCRSSPASTHWCSHFST